MGETMTPVRDSIEAKLTEAFAPEALEIIDESEKHRHHGHGIEGGETHFKVVMRAPDASIARPIHMGSSSATVTMANCGT